MTELSGEAKLEAQVESTLLAARRALPQWNAGRQQEVKWAIMARLDPPTPRRWVPVWTLGGVVAVVAVVVGWRYIAPASPDRAELALPKLADGSSIVLDGPTAILKKTAETNEDVTFQLEAGGAHFEVARRPSRIFRVHAGGVTVQVIGTRFHVQRQDARSKVTVDRGKVLVSWWGGSRELAAGEEGIFPPERAPQASRQAAAYPVAAPAAGTPPTARRAAAGRSAVGPSSPASMERAVAASGPQALFARADRARSEGRPELAISHLREILARYPKDPHAPMAAFTVGRLLLETLQKPRQAALAFSQARALASGGPLVEDALAREVESLHAAGDSTAARQRALLYAQLFPHGPRLHAVMRFGGLRSAP